MKVSRRTVIAITSVFASCAASTRIVGAQGMRSVDEQRAQQILNALPRHGYYEIMLRLAEITSKGSTGESFNSRWRSARNPLITKLFQDVGYSDPVYDNCAPWCAVALAWCLQRDGRPLPPNPVASQSYLHYGAPVETPRLGDICIFTEVDNPAEGHVGLFSGFVDGDKISVLGGNQKGDEETRCGPGFLKSYITFEDVEINRARRMTDNGLYLRQIRRPPDRIDIMIAAKGAGHGPTGLGSHAAAAPGVGERPPVAGAARTATPQIRLADLSRLLPSTADLAQGVRTVEALPPVVGQTAIGLTIGALGANSYFAGKRAREAQQALNAQRETNARRQLEIVEKLATAGVTGGLHPSQDGLDFGQSTKAFALFLAAEFKQTPIAKIRKGGVPAKVAQQLEDLESRVPSHHAVVTHLSALKLALIRLLNHVDASTKRSRTYQAIFDGEVTPALQNLFAALGVELTPEEHHAVITTPVYSRPMWIRIMTPQHWKIRAAPQRA